MKDNEMSQQELRLLVGRVRSNIKSELDQIRIEVEELALRAEWALSSQIAGWEDVDWTDEEEKVHAMSSALREIAR